VLASYIGLFFFLLFFFSWGGKSQKEEEEEEEAVRLKEKERDCGRLERMERVKREGKKEGWGTAAHRQRAWARCGW